VTRFRLVCCAVLLLAAAGLLAGCGGGAVSAASTASGPPLSKAQYQKKLRQIVSAVGARYGTLPTNPGAISSGDLATAEHGLRVLADRLARVSPPPAVARLHADYVDALRSLADELPELTARMRKDPAAGLDVLLGSASVQELLRTARAFTEKGYTLDPDRP